MSELDPPSRIQIDAERILAALIGEVDIVDEHIAALMKKGDDRAQRILRNPWGTSETPDRALRRISAALTKLDDALSDQAPELLGKLLLRRILADHRDVYLARRSGPGVEAADEVDENTRAILELLGVTARQVKRLSQRDRDEVASLIRDRADPPRSGSLTRDDLQRAGCLEKVCAPLDWGWDTRSWSREDLIRLAQRGVWLPEPIKCDPPRLPRDFADRKDQVMHPIYWDTKLPSQDHAYFDRAAAEDEAHLYYGSSMPEAMIPKYQTVGEMKLRCPDFRARYEEAEKLLARLESIRSEASAVHAACVEEDDWDDYGDSPAAEFEVWSSGEREIWLDDNLWEGWKPFGLVHFAAHKLLESNPDEYEDCRVWAYLLAGRRRRFQTAEQKRIRELMFDWLRLPLMSTEVPAVRCLVPRDVLKSSASNDSEFAAAHA